MEARGAQTATGQVLPETRTLHAVDSTWELAHTASPHQPPPDPQTHWNLLCASQQAWGCTQDGRVMVERSDRMWSTVEGNGSAEELMLLNCGVGEDS